MVLGAAEGLHALAVGRAGPIDIFADGGRPDEADGRDIGMMQQRIDRRLVAVDAAPDAVRQSRLLPKLREQKRGGRIGAPTAC